MAKINLTYKGDKPADAVALGAFSQIAAKRLYGMEALKSDDPEPVLYACYVELNGAAAAKKSGPEGFDKWLETIANFELSDTSDPSTATKSSESSPELPPTTD